ncbi:hypothetical protein B0H66DRAFT_583417 [Apodospora peruviana]|uniref:Protein kinase domain-containing protein n=1 Tax=Apodospora peruviana TaxID=516989 RepID=A0AAE0I202_9PEZI|nr:hypothetical protein B0H66DRAFT_583417 [Apodospora peruviana]
MEMSCDLVDAIWRPSFVFKHPRLRSRQWTDVQNRVNALPTTNSSRWRIDGAATFKTRFFALPLDLLDSCCLPPLRIDLFLPDQALYPPALRQSLDATRGVLLLHPSAVAALGISRYLCRALDYCARNKDFLTKYSRLPFGSTIIIDNVVADTTKINLTVEPKYSLESAANSLPEILQQPWVSNVPPDRWPPSIDIFNLSVVRQIHDSVTLLANFKSGSDDFHHVLNELKLLLTTSPHPNIKSAFCGKQAVLGFLLPYFPAGSIRDILPAFIWCIQMSSALIHVLEEGCTFYSDLRPDNVLLSDGGHVVLCDFEQRGNWHEWCPPEILYPQYFENLVANRRRSSDPTWNTLMSTYQHDRPEAVGGSFVHSKNRPWYALSLDSQEKAMVYTLGLFIYCVFEGLSSVRPSIAYHFPIEPEVNFPEFRRTPSKIRELIRSCTVDAPQWDDNTAHHDAPLRKGALGNEPLHCNATGQQAAEIVLDAAQDFWINELEQARKFFNTDQWRTQKFGRDRPSLKEVMNSLKNIQLGTLEQ